MAMNKQQALAYKKHLKEREGKPYGANPGESTEGFAPGDRRYVDGQWQLSPEKFAALNDMSDYMDTVIDASGMNGASNNVQGSPSGNAGKGGGGKETETAKEPSPADEQSVQDALDSGISLEEIVAGGILGSGATLLAQRLLKNRKGGQPDTGGGKGAAQPASDTAGEADKGGQSSAVGPTRANAAQQVIDGTFDEILGLPPVAQQLPAPQDNVSSVAQGTQPASEVRNPAAPAALPAPYGSDIDAMIRQVDDPNQPLADPDLERALQSYANQIRESGDPQFDARNALNPSLNPDLPMMDQAMMQRLRAILAGMI